MAAPGLSALSTATRLSPTSPNGFSRPRSRSPVRKSQFAARELDPLLQNLSPDSTLKALQATNTIGTGTHEQDVLAKSIADATPAEREMGIRAAIAAQKLKQWHQELLAWPWPNRRDRTWGAGFLSPQHTSTAEATSPGAQHLGSLPALKVDEYRARIENIRDGIEALELEDMKDHIFTAHSPQRSVSAPQALASPIDMKSTGYGRMRDFTALITATVIQALPELANLTILLETWEVRLAVLRHIPELKQAFRSTRAGIKTAFSIVRHVKTGQLVTHDEYETTKNILGGKVSSIGTTVDKLLDILEGQEDSLPKVWIDTLESIEIEYATWVVEAEHIVIRNDLLARALGDQDNLKDMDLCRDDSRQEPNTAGAAEPIVTASKEISHSNILEPDKKHQDSYVEQAEDRSPIPHSEIPSTTPTTFAPIKPSLRISPPSQGHNRGVSEASVANSAYSAISDISIAEIADARSAQIVTSPKISMVENSTRSGRDEFPFLGTPALTPDSNSDPRPPLLQRASTASIEMISRNSIKRVTLIRSRSQDLLKQTPPAAIQSQQHGEPKSTVLEPNIPYERSALQNDTLTVDNNNLLDTASSTVSPTPSLRVEPLQIRSRESANPTEQSPALPRRSSKRLSQTLFTQANIVSPATAPDLLAENIRQHDNVSPHNQTQAILVGNDMQAKIKEVLETVPSRIQMLDEHGTSTIRQNATSQQPDSAQTPPTFTIMPIASTHAETDKNQGNIRVFSLSRSDQSKTGPPTKLFVRAVGEHGERIMVRVGGGWADLGQYLREYTAHHGSRLQADGGFDVVEFPLSQGDHRIVSSPSPATSSDSSSRQVTTLGTLDQRKTFPNSLNTTDPTQININKVRRTNRDQITDVSLSGSSPRWTPPPVPPIPPTYTTQFPTTVTTTVNGYTNTRTLDSSTLTGPGNQRVFSAPTAMSCPHNQRPQSATPIQSNRSSTLMSPSGAFTPQSTGSSKFIGQGSGTPSSVSSGPRESWMEGTVGRARAVSGGTSIVYGPTTTTTTTVISRSNPSRRRMSAVPSPSPIRSQGTASPASSDSKVSPSPDRQKNRMNFSEMTGIKRVFLRNRKDDAK